jgi:hypothetical protein
MLSAVKETGTIFTARSTISNYRTLDIDTNGNGKRDIVTIKINIGIGEYELEILNDNNKKFILCANDNPKFIGQYLENWPLNLSVADINIDKTPEIIIQVPSSSQDSGLYIFRWDGGEYKKILSGAYDGISITDINSDGLPEVIAGKRSIGTGEALTAYKWSAGTYNKANNELGTYYRGYDKIRKVMGNILPKYGDSISSEKQLSLFFTNDWINDIKNREYLKNFSRDIVCVELQDYINEDIGLNKEEVPSLSSWDLRYLVFRKYGNLIKAENCTAQIILEITGKSERSYKIKKLRFKY